MHNDFQRINFTCVFYDLIEHSTCSFDNKHCSNNHCFHLFSSVEDNISKMDQSNVVTRRKECEDIRKRLDEARTALQKEIIEGEKCIQQAFSDFADDLRTQYLSFQETFVINSLQECSVAIVELEDAISRMKKVNSLLSKFSKTLPRSMLVNTEKSEAPLVDEKTP